MGMLDDLAIYLDANTSLVDGTDLFANFMPPDPDEVVAIYETGVGPSPDETYGDGTLPIHLRRSIQVRARAGERDEPTARDLIDTAWQALAQIANQDVNGNRFLRVSLDNGPFLLMTDGDDRSILAANMTAIRVP